MPVNEPRLRVLSGGSAAAPDMVAVADPLAFQQLCLEAYEASQVARGFSPVTMENGAGVLARLSWVIWLSALRRGL